MLYTTIFNNYNDRLKDLLIYQKRGDREEFETLKNFLDRRLENSPKLEKWLRANSEYDHRGLEF